MRSRRVGRESGRRAEVGTGASIYLKFDCSGRALRPLMRRFRGDQPDFPVPVRGVAYRSPQCGMGAVSRQAMLFIDSLSRPS